MSIEAHNHRVAILASGSGSTAEAFIHATQDGRVAAEVGLIVCSQPRGKAAIFDRVDRLNAQFGLDIEVVHIGATTHPEGNIGRGQTLSESAAICDLGKRRGIEHFALMGYMRIVQGDLLDQYGYHFDRHTSELEADMTNNHPAPLPYTRDTYGAGASAKVLELGMKRSCHTLHVVSAGVDAGPIIAEHPVEVKEDDTPQSLFERVQIAEKVGLPYALGKFLREQDEDRRRKINEAVTS